MTSAVPTQADYIIIGGGLAGCAHGHEAQLLTLTAGLMKLATLDGAMIASYHISGKQKGVHSALGWILSSMELKDLSMLYLYLVVILCENIPCENP
jgi:hypothetical protein